MSPFWKLSLSHQEHSNSTAVGTYIIKIRNHKKLMRMKLEFQEQILCHVKPCVADKAPVP
jgi:hypothetical protein